MKILVLGNFGMLGNYVYQYFRNKNALGFNRSNFDIDDPENYLKEYNNSVIINCIGLIPQKSGSVFDYIKTNTVLPHKLQEICEKTNSNLIHITTDCVFSGNRGFYNEYDVHDSIELYGKTKSLGEPENATIIRTSIIGEEKQNKRSLLEWVKSNKNQEVKGYINHLWNGITCLQFAKICEKIIDKNIFWKGVKHIYSPSEINKFELVKMISDIYELNINVIPHQTKKLCHRTLISNKKDVDFDIPNLKDQLLEQKNYLKDLKRIK